MPSYSVTPSATPGGGIVSTTITTPGDTVTITFTGTAGHRISIQINNISYSGSAGAADFAITNPDSTAGPSDTKNAALPVFDYVLPQTGTYTLTITPWTSGTGTCEMEFYTSVDHTDTVTPTGGGTALSVTLATPGEQEIVSFPGAIGESLTIAQSSWAMGTKHIAWIRPDGSTFYSDDINHASTGTATLDATGTWKFVISTYMHGGGNDAYGTCTLTFTGTGPTIISHEYDLTGSQAVSASRSVARTFSASQPQSLSRGDVAQTFAVSQPQGVTVLPPPGGTASSEFDVTQGQIVSLVGPSVTIHVLAMIPAVEMIGRPLLELVGQLIRPVAITSAEAIGSADVEIVAPQEISLVGRSWIDPEGVGIPSLSLTGASEILPTGVSLLSDVGVPVLMGGVGGPSPVGPRSVPRNVLIDRKTHEVYPWPLNHSSEDALRALGRRITRSGITASGKLLATRKVFLIKHLSQPGPSRMMLHGTFTDRTSPTQYQSFVRFFQECDDRTFDFVDASGDAYHIAITQFDARRKQSKAHDDGSYFDYSLECEILDVYSGALLGFTR